eukprot:TRINITY_DN64613_c0_g1_i1.p1 TRINITY_DN64613_c0_g1~~TRINITY_DN64613_c0_g1_i1.p1  ORF type:complete len:410 (+),score=56.43 TRINITY_DN64613_c0_g1_i1:126-1232(+)
MRPENAELNSMDSGGPGIFGNWEKTPPTMTRCKGNNVNPESQCCSCDRESGGLVEKGIYMQMCQGVNYNQGYTFNIYCCSTWASSCDQNDPLFETRISKMCSITDEECDQGECAGFEEQETALSSQRSVLQKTIDYAQGTSQVGSIRCSCGCGALSNEGAFQCESLKSSLTCPSLRPCCRGSSCKDGDPWLKTIEESKTKITELSTQLSELSSAKTSCRKTCKSNYLDECKHAQLQKLQAIVEGTTTQQMVDAKREWKMITETNKQREQKNLAERKEWLADQERQRNEEKKKRNARLREERMQTFSNMMGKVGSAVTGAAQSFMGQSCCNCAGAQGCASSYTCEQIRCASEADRTKCFGERAPTACPR